jgi:hypothetical protein
MTLAYNNTKKDHIGHLRVVLDTMAQQKSYDKKSWPNKNQKSKLQICLSGY